MGAGGRLIKSALSQGLVNKMVANIITPALRAKIKEEFNCTDEDINRALQEGVTEFGNDFKQLLADQHKQLIPPPEDDKNDPNTT